MTGKVTRRAVIAGMAGTICAPHIAQAAWPERPVSIIHGFGAGGNADVVARIIAEALTQKLGTQFIVEPKTGAGGTLAAAHVARSKPDGYTLAVLPGGHPVAAAMYKNLPYRTVEDFTWISLMTDYPFIMATYNEHPAKTLAQMIEYGKKAKEPLLCANVGNGSGQHLSGELFGSMSGATIKPVPYKGGAEGMLDVIGQRVDLIFDTPTVLLEPVKAGQIRALGVTTAQRFFALPDVPTLNEAGVKGYDTSSWLGLAGPAGLPDDLAARLNVIMREVLADPAVIKKLNAIGSNVVPTSGDELRKKVADEVVKWTKVVNDAKIDRL
jgi:tripartite-type tricarboxylate transporter receptor subunit TctC